jgi:predicted YcjX-like family ATPase
LFDFLKEIELPFKIPLPDKTIRVAVTGLSRSGKTVFLTSLINQLLANDKLKYFNEKSGRMFVARLLPPDSNYQRFDYYAKLKAFQQANPTWPKPTKQVTKTTLQLEFKSEYKLFENEIINLELIDYPGEWLLDLSMLDQSFEKWSSQTLLLAKDSKREEYSHDYFRILEESDLYGESDGSRDFEIHDAYCEYLKTLHYNHFSFTQPGRFLEPGDMAGDPLLHFAPLPTPKGDQTVDKNSIYSRYKKRYELYLKEVVSKLYLEHFKYFDTQIILVDLIKTLEYGEDSYNDMNLAFKHILKSFTYGSNNFLTRLFGLKIDHAIFAATKADHIPPPQYDAYRDLLYNLIVDLKRELDILDTRTDVTIFSAVKSTEFVEAEVEGEVVECVRGVVEGEDKPSTHYPGVIPDDIKGRDFWKEHRFSFADFKPKRFPSNSNEAVDHIRMDRIIYSILRKHL